MKKTLTDYLKVPNTAHVLYCFEDMSLYLDNMIAYCKGGIERGHHLYIIENPVIFDKAKQKISTLFTSDQQKLIHYMDNHLFYRYYGNFHIHKILQHFGEIINSFIEEKLSVWTWAHVEWNKQDDLACKLEEFEHLGDYAVNKMGIMSVCAYNSSDLNAALQTKIMRSHEYLMTDTEFSRSPLYKRNAT